MGRKGGGQRGFVKASRASAAPEEGPSTAPGRLAGDEAREGPGSQDAGETRCDLRSQGTDGDRQGVPAEGQPSTSPAAPGRESKTKMRERHQRELMALKRLSGKGKKKDQYAVQMKELKDRHDTELKELERLQATEEEDASPTGSAGAQAESTGSHEAGHGGADSEGQTALVASGTKLGEDGNPKDSPRHVTRAQRRRQKAAAKELERDARIAEELSQMGESARSSEERELKAKLAPMGLRIQDIKPDGHCMYRAIEDQLSRPGPASKTYQELRELAASYIRSHQSDFYPFLVDEDVEDALEAHCINVESTAEWGGEMELIALSQALERPLVVHSAGMPDQFFGEEFVTGDKALLRLCFMRHAFNLGCHYNSVVKEEESNGSVDLQDSWETTGNK
ncbi:unnamed protein product [Ostreobium quekettii]|uniref:OTU domain-containing protein n=1 Tax=Ostreobium quekettii TaxID=121088 RepID=A0A8S1IT29_9CHLO|nr:unnamed protein product [Ostreobium quekettii]|eukprot:evm.model.scf_1217.3 EVM.evm.TU.scf_1217.3   scf_1217:29252-30436(+)